jgi:NAD(P)-dependent dehydrogenase (short-subunit alcohol dehydrogenase family)
LIELSRIRGLFDISGKVALITGAAGTLGAAFAEALASEGAKIFLIDRRGGELSKVASDLQVKGLECEWLEADLTNEEDINRAFKKCEDNLRRIDILVNSVGDSVYKPTLELSLTEWNRVISVNLTSAFLCSRRAAKSMIEAGIRGKIINVASIYGLRADRFPIAAYYSSKAGLINLTKALAVEWARYGINVNAIAPSFVSSRLTRVILEDLKSREYVLSRTPLRRLAQPEDLLGALIFLASSASDYVTGQVISVDGGWCAW